MNIDPITNGIVIDHIPAGQAMELYSYLNLNKLDCEIAMILNAPSEKYGRKDIIKINQLIDLNLDVLGYIDPQITVAIIQDGEKAEKKHPAIPDQLVNVVRCKNPRCITTVEQELPQIFKLTDRENRVYRCVYCETKVSR